MSLVYNTNDSVINWLNDLKFNPEVECMSILQGKSIIKNYPPQFTTECLKDKIINIDNECNKVFERINEHLKNHNKDNKFDNLQSTLDSVIKLSVKIKEVNKSFNKSTEEMKMFGINYIRLKSLIESVEKITVDDVNEIDSYFQAIKISINEIHNQIISCLIQLLVEELQDNKLKISTLNDINNLSLISNFHVYITKANGIKKICDILENFNTIDIQLICLKILCNLCNCRENIILFNNNNGFNQLSIIISNNAIQDKIRFESLRLLSIIYDPINSIGEEFNGYFENLQDILTSLLDLMLKASDFDEKLLCLSAIFNLINYDDICMDIMCDQNLIHILATSFIDGENIQTAIMSKLLSILEILSYNEYYLEEFKRNDVQNILFNNIKNIKKLICPSSQSLQLYILISSIKILNKMLLKSIELKSIINDIIGDKMLEDLIIYFPELTENAEFKSFLNAK